MAIKRILWNTPTGPKFFQVPENMSPSNYLNTVMAPIWKCLKNQEHDLVPSSWFSTSETTVYEMVPRG